jgi:hypothetical protein
MKRGSIKTVLGKCGVGKESGYKLKFRYLLVLGSK